MLKLTKKSAGSTPITTSPEATTPPPSALAGEPPKKKLVLKSPASSASPVPIPSPSKKKPRAGRNLDGVCRVGLGNADRAYAAYYLTTSYCYYQLGWSVISDELYDEICKTLYARWDDIEHEHKYLIDKEALLRGTGSYLPFVDLPLRIVGAAQAMVKEAQR